MQLIKNIYIKNFRSIKEVSIDCRKLNIFSGLNDAGKSTVLKALNLFFNGETDFNTPFNFEVDYNKNARVSKKTKEIVIRIEFNLPDSYTSTKQSFPIAFQEKRFTPHGEPSLQSTLDEITTRSRANQKNLLSRFFASIEYVYVPAFKDIQVQQKLLQKLADLEIVDESKISSVNEDIQNRLQEMQKILQELGMSFQTKFEIPMYGKDFWNHLDINTTYDNFSDIQQTLKRRQAKPHAISGKGYDIPLLYRGEGIKSKFIPAFLSWYQSVSTKQIIWGIDEPENSLEIEAARKLANLFINEYSKRNQIFITTHSAAFLATSNTNVNLFRCWKDDKANTIIQLISQLSETEKIKLFKELGVLEIEKEQQALYENKIRLLEQEEGNLKHLIKQNKKLILLPEDKNITIYQVAWLALHNINFEPNNFKYNFDRNANFTIPDLQEAGADPLSSLFKNPLAQAIFKKQKIVALFDCDRTGIEKFKRLAKKGTLYDEECNVYYVKITEYMYAFLLPIPDRFKNLIDVQDINSAAFLEIELLLPKELLLEKKWAQEKQNGQLQVVRKKTIHEHIYSLKKEHFQDFQNIFNFLKKINSGKI